MLPRFDKGIQYILRNSLGRLDGETIGFTHDVPGHFLTAHIGIVVVVEGIEVTAHQLVDHINAATVRPSVRHFGKLAHHIGYGDIMRRAVEIVLHLLFGYGQRCFKESGINGTKNFLGKLIGGLRELRTVYQ